MKVLSCFLLCIIGCQPAMTSNGEYLRMEMSGPQQAVLLIVETNGVIHFGGGQDAMEGKTTWTGQMTSGQQVALYDLVAQSDWLATTKGSSVLKTPAHFSVRIRKGMIDNQFDLPMSDPMGTSVYDLLQTITLARLDPYLNALPKPNMDMIIDRKTKEDAIP